MSRTLYSLGFVGLTLALVAPSGEATSASGDAASRGQGGRVATNGSGHGSHRILRTAQKSRKKGSVPRKPAAEPAGKEPAPGAAAKPGDPDDSGLKFSRDIAPIFVSSCIRCHNEKAMAKNGKLDLTSFEKLKKGGADGAIVEPGKPEESHLYLRLTGEETPRMPRGANNRLSEAAIEKVGAWIKAGARLDAGLDPKAPVASYASTPEQLRMAELAKLPAQEREKRVEEKGLERWKKGNPKDKPEVFRSKTFVLIGTLPKERANTALRTLETLYAQIRGIVAKTPAGESLEKTGVYVFNQRAHFVEFVRSQENREVDRAEQGTSNLSVEAPYVAVLDPLGGQPESAATRKSGRSKKGQVPSAGVDRSLAGLIAEQLATGTVRRESDKAPAWVSLGLGAYFGSRVDPRSPNTLRLRRTAFEQFEFGWNTKANEALGGEAKPENVRAIGFGIFEALGANPQTRPYLANFVKGMLPGAERLDDVLGEVYEINREQFLEGTGSFVGTNYGR